MNADLLEVSAPYLAAARVILGCWLMLVSAQWIAGAAVFGPDGAMPWARMPGVGVIGRARRCMSSTVMRLWMMIQFAIALGLLAAAPLPLACVLLLAALMSHGSFILLTGEYGASGADKMGLIVLAGTMIGSFALVTGDAALLLAGFMVSGGQLLISYATSGFAKIFQPNWRSGAELRGVMAHDIWGAPWAAALLRPRGVAFAVSWALMLGEALFPLLLFAPEAWLMAALAAMFIFHIATALIMRLNLFPLAFIAAYPSVLMLAKAVGAWRLIG